MAETEGMTVSEALAFLDPPIPRRTLERRLAPYALPELRKPPGRGRPAHAYPIADIMREHTAWTNSNVGKRPTRTETGEPQQ